MAELISADCKCPNCGEAWNIEPGPWEGADNGEAWLRIHCLSCGCYYDEVYRYAGAVILDDDDPALG